MTDLEAIRLDFYERTRSFLDEARRERRALGLPEGAPIGALFEQMAGRAPPRLYVYPTPRPPDLQQAADYAYTPPIYSRIAALSVR